jgi:uncharacterized Fe-S radical SAM superfamily protein PflX
MSRATLHKPSYLHLSREELRRRVDAAWELMASPCRVCPRGCKVDRRRDEGALADDQPERPPRQAVREESSHFRLFCDAS